MPGLLPCDTNSDCHITERFHCKNYSEDINLNLIADNRTTVSYLTKIFCQV